MEGSSFSSSSEVLGLVGGAGVVLAVMRSLVEDGAGEAEAAGEGEAVLVGAASAAGSFFTET